MECNNGMVGKVAAKMSGDGGVGQKVEDHRMDSIDGK